MADQKTDTNSKPDKPHRCYKCHKNLTPEEIKRNARRLPFGMTSEEFQKYKEKCNAERKQRLANMTPEEKSNFDVSRKLAYQVIQANRVMRESPADGYAALSRIYQDLTKIKEWLIKDKIAGMFYRRLQSAQLNGWPEADEFMKTIFDSQGYVHVKAQRPTISLEEFNASGQNQHLADD